MNILIASGIFPPDIGGPATYVPSIASALAARGHGVTVVTMSGALPDEDGYPFRVVPILRRGARIARWTAAAGALVREGRTAHVVFAAGLLPQAVAASMRRRRPLVARVVSDLAWDRSTAYGWTTEDLQTFQRRRHGIRIEVLKTMQRWAILRATRIIVPSRWLAGWVGRLGVPPEILRVIPNALALLPVVTPTRMPVRTSYLIATAGRLVPVKQIDLLIRALAFVPDASLLVIGDGPYRDALQHLAADLGLADRVIFTGAKRREEALALVAGCDALVSSSSHEGFPYALLEAMSLGVPVVATPVGGVAEIVAHDHNGLLVDGTEAALAQGLRHLLEAPDLRRRLAATAREDVAHRFRVDEMVAATEQVLREAAGA